jgi:Flp pilus assembly protein TadD
VLTILDPTDDRSIGMVKHNLGLALARTEQPEEALRQMAQARIHREDLPLAERDRATALQRLGRTEEALALYRSAIARNPLDLGAHTELNKLLYREGDDAAFLKSYDEAFAKNRQESQLPFAKGAALLGLHRYEPALEAFAQALHLAPDDPVVLNCYAVTAGALGRAEEAVAMHERSAALSPDGINGNSNFATTLLRVGDPQRALQMLAGNLQRAPLDQNTLALMSVAFRALGDPRDAWLMGYDTLVRVFDLEPPAGYADIASFNRELDAYLNAVHTDKREYPDQTLRGGTQSPGDLFSGRYGGGPVAALKTRIDEAVQQYIAALGDDGRHPLLGRKRQDFAYAGSWSSRLHDSGRHTNHIHMRGWISSAYYVAVPDAVDDAEAKRGWIKFGEPNFDARLPDAVKRAVQPKPGRLVLFPSYMWHGTNPFRSTSARTTIAFDVIPA